MIYVVPRGLEYLTQLDQVLVKQIFELCEILSGCETKNRYVLTNSLKQEWATAVEDTSCLNRQCCGPIRPFDMNITDNQGMEIIHMERPLACTGSCCPCCLQSITISSSGQTLGSVHQEWSFCTPMGVDLTVRDAADNTVFKIKGPCCAFSCCGTDVDFMVISNDGQEMGKISKTWKGCCAEAFTDADAFSISFPLDLDVKAKALLIGAMFLVDFMFFE
ncbi:unnamed protein product, partial [Meganyctiphanes norvegica]